MPSHRIPILTLLVAIVGTGTGMAQAPTELPAPKGVTRTVIVLPKSQAPAPKAPAAAAQPGTAATPAPASTSVVVTDPFTAVCNNACGHGSRSHCNIQWLKPWTCDDLKMEPFKAPPSYCGCKGFFWCPPEPEEPKEENGNGDKNGNGEKKNGNGDKKNGNGNGEKKNGNGEKKNGNGNGNGEEKKEEEEAEEEPTPTPLMAWIQCRFPSMYNRLDCCDTKIYGWMQGGFTGNFDSPRDRLNYGVNFNNRSNDVLLNQLYFVIEKPLDLDKKKDCFHMGYRADFFFGHDTPYWENLLGVFPNFLGDRLEVSRLTENGISLPQAYLDFHLPILTDRGVDVRAGRFYTLMGFEVNPAPSTYFYSHNYEFFYGMPFTHTGVLATVHLTDTLDFANGYVRGWDVCLSDTNDTGAYIGGLLWNSCDKRNSIALTWVTGPEQLNNNHNYRTALCLYYTRLFGCYNEWRFVTGGHGAWEPGASLDPTPTVRSAEWYGYCAYLFYTVNPKLTLGMRAEWFRDDDGARTVFTNSDNGGARWNRPGYAGNFYEVTFGATWKPYQNLRIRPEIRFDWFDGVAIDGSNSLPFNDQTDSFQTTFGIDLIWEF